VGSAFTTDFIAYLNLILGIDTKTIEGTSVTSSAVDYSAFTYDREATLGDVTTTILVQQADGSWVATEVNIYSRHGDRRDASGLHTGCRRYPDDHQLHDDGVEKIDQMLRAAA
jgi:hypothetical protein